MYTVNDWGVCSTLLFVPVTGLVFFVVFADSMLACEALTKRSCLLDDRSKL